MNPIDILALHQWDENAQCRAECSVSQMDSTQLAAHQIAMLNDAGYIVVSVEAGVVGTNGELPATATFTRAPEHTAPGGDCK